jgi:hypothetical protein
LFIAFSSTIYYFSIFYLGLNSDIVVVAIARTDDFHDCALYCCNRSSGGGYQRFLYFNYRNTFSRIIGYLGGSFTIMEFTQKCYEGFTSMTDILSMLRWFSRISRKGGRNHVFTGTN